MFKPFSALAKKAVTFGLFTFLVLAAALVIAEFALRAAGFGSVQIHRETDSGLVVRAPESGYLHHEENLNFVHYNNLGFHDRGRAPAGSGTRVTVIGDSYVEGAQVPVDATFTRRAEIILNKENRDVKIVNAGTSGTATGYQYLLWKEVLAPAIKTDVLLVCLYLGDDLAQNHPVLNRRFLKRPVHERHYFVSESGEVQAVHKPRSPLLLFFRELTRHSRVLYFFYQELGKLKHRLSPGARPTAEKQTPNPASSRNESLGPYWNESIRGTMALLRRWKEEAENGGARFAVMVIPSSGSLGEAGYGHPALDRMAEELRAWSQQQSVPLLEIDFSGADPYALYSFDGKTLGHFAYQGHARTGRQLADWLKTEIL